MEYKKIEEQEAVLNCSGKNMIVSASAGSGKSTVMVNRIMNILLDEKNYTDVKELLILTFTNASANELLSKITKKLTQKATTNTVAQKQLSSLPFANISTFHSFFQKLINSYGHLVGEQAEYSLCDETQSKILKGNAFDVVQQKIKGEFEVKLQEIFDFFGEGFSFDDLKSIIIYVCDFSTNLPNKEEFFSKTKTKLYDNINFVKDAYARFIIEKCDALKTYEEAMISSIRQDDERLKAFLLQFLNETESLSKAKDFSSLQKLFCCAQKRKSKPSNTNLTDLEEKTLSAMVARHKKQLDKTATLFKNFNEQELESYFVFAIKVIENICFFATMFDEEYSNQKAKNKLMDFSDLERFAFLVLQNSEARSEIKNSFKYIFVDEYQDTNFVQEKLISLIAKENNLFMVGDVKQCIYKFRQSCPEIFLQKCIDYSQKEGCQHFKLNSSFRSRREILDFANNIFSRIITKNVFGIDYKNDAMLCGEIDFFDSDKNAVEFLLYDERNSEKEMFQAENLYDIKKDFSHQDKTEQTPTKILAKAVSQRISKILASEEIYDSKEGKKRSVTFSDIAILVKSRTHIDDLKEALESVSIPCVLDSRESLFDLPEILPLKCAIIASAYPFVDSYFVGLLTSPIFNISNETLFQMSKENGNSFYEKYLAYAKKHSEIAKLESLSKFLGNIKLVGSLPTFCDAFLRLLDEIEYRFNFAGKSIDEAVCQFADQLSKFSNVFEMADYLCTQPNEKTKSDFDSDSIVITTMHSSKGLEWPVVILFDLSNSLLRTNSKNFSKLGISTELGFAVTNSDEKDFDLPYQVYKNQKLKDEMTENYRLLYVAITRAKNKLILCGEVKTMVLAENGDVNIFAYDNYLQTILSTFSQDQLDKLYFCTSGKLCDYTSFEYVQKSIESAVLNEITTNVELDKTKFFYRKKFDYEKPLKTSVTNIVGQKLDFQIVDELEAQTNIPIVEKKWQANEIGTAFHKLYQLCPFDDVDRLDDIFKSLKESEDVFNSINFVDIEKIKANIKKIKEICGEGDFFKEQKFLMKENGQIIQGAVDLLCVGGKVSLIDYKYSSKDSQSLKATYSQQLNLYKLATEKWLKRNVDNLVIFNIKSGEYINL